MENNKTLKELGAEYEKAAEIVKRRIERKRQQLNALEDSVCSNEAYEIKRELQFLYAELRETKTIAEYLKSYYDPHIGKKELFEYK